MQVFVQKDGIPFKVLLQAQTAGSNRLGSRDDRGNEIDGRDAQPGPKIG